MRARPLPSGLVPLLVLLTVGSASAQDVAFRLATTDTAGRAVSTVGVGDTVRLDVYAEDVRATPQGVFAAYLDVTWTQVDALVGVAGSLSHGARYDAGRAGAIAAGRIDEAGGFTSNSTPSGAGETLVFSVDLTAAMEASVVLASEPADDTPQHDVLVFGNDLAIPASDISYGTATLTIGPAGSGGSASGDADEGDGGCHAAYGGATAAGLALVLLALGVIRRRRWGRRAR